MNLSATEQEVRDIQGRLEEAELEIAGLATGLYWDYPMTSARPEIRTKALDV